MRKTEGRVDQGEVDQKVSFGHVASEMLETSKWRCQTGSWEAQGGV